MSAIAQLIREIVKPMFTVSAFTGKVVDVDKNSETCTVLPDDEGPELFNVRLTAVIKPKDSKQLLIPVVGSEVIVAILDNNVNNCYIALFSQIEKIEWRADEIVFNDGDNGGIIIKKSLEAEIEKLNQHVKAINKLLTTWTPLANDGGAALKTAAGLVLPSQQYADLSNITNDKVKH